MKKNQNSIFNQKSEIFVVSVCLCNLATILLSSILQEKTMGHDLPPPFSLLDEETGSEHQIAFSELPDNVKAIAISYLGHERPFNVTKEIDNEMVFFEIAVEKDGLKQEIKVTDDYLLVEFEEELSEDQIPGKILKKITGILPGSKIRKTEAVYRCSYEVKAEVNGDMREFEILPTGQILTNKQDD